MIASRSEPRTGTGHDPNKAAAAGRRGVLADPVEKLLLFGTGLGLGACLTLGLCASVAGRAWGRFASEKTQIEAGLCQRCNLAGASKRGGCLHERRPKNRVPRPS
jgi:hypothetical protein